MRKGEASRRYRYLSATFLYCKRQGALKVNPVDRGYLLRQPRVRCLPTLKVQAKTAFQVLHCPYPETVLLLRHLLLFLLPCFFACCFCDATYLLPVPLAQYFSYRGKRKRRGIGTKKSLSVDSCPALPRELGLLQLFSPGYERNIKIHLRPQ